MAGSPCGHLAFESTTDAHWACSGLPEQLCAHAPLGPGAEGQADLQAAGFGEFQAGQDRLAQGRGQGAEGGAPGQLARGEVELGPEGRQGLLGHPEVYVIVVPATAGILELMVVFLRKPLFSYKMAVAGFAGVVGISAVVWVHHMYMTGFAPQAGYPFMLSTELISIPFGFLVLVMLGTLWRGKAWNRLPMMAVYAVIFDQIIGGITGVYLSDVPVDQYMHGSMFVVAHFHYMLMGAGLFAAMGVIVYWFPKMTGRMFDERIGKIGFWTAFLAFQVTFLSMFVAGLQGMPRRVLQFDNAFDISNWISTIGAYCIGIGMLIFLYAVITSWRNGKVAPSNPWGAKTLEWQTETPVPLENFPVLPVVTSDPYGYGIPDPYLKVEEELDQDDNETVGAR